MLAPFPVQFVLVDDFSGIVKGGAKARGVFVHWHAERAHLGEQLPCGPGHELRVTQKPRWRAQGPKQIVSFF